jgi:hypothetical protein
MLDRFFHQINAPKFLLLSLKSFIAKKKHGICKKIFIKKEKDLRKKYTSVRDIENNGYPDVCLKKRER